jgi:hypothetical protein
MISWKTASRFSIFGRMMIEIKTITWEIAMTQFGFEILRDGVKIRAVDGDIDDARSALNQLIAASATQYAPDRVRAGARMSS